MLAWSIGQNADLFWTLGAFEALPSIDGEVELGHVCEAAYQCTQTLHARHKIPAGRVLIRVPGAEKRPKPSLCGRKSSRLLKAG